ncbi:MAG: csrA [Pseudonocardiales bacterium]|nr:csrA [Pseudonocardiales bacterium]
MLILTRRVGESIVVGDDIVLTVFEVRGDAVRVGIEAPRSVQVHRQEVYDELKRLNEQSVSPSDDAVDALRDALGGAEPPADQPDLSLVPDETDPASGPAPQSPAPQSSVAEPPAAQSPATQTPATQSPVTQSSPRPTRPGGRRAKPAPPVQPRPKPAPPE